MKKVIQIILVMGILVLATAASASIPDFWGVWNWEYSDPVHLMVLPSGGGPSFAEASFIGGVPVDATIHVQLWLQDGWNPAGPLANFPAEDLWLHSPGLVSCPSGASADADTDSEGWFSFSLPPRMGGWADSSSEPAALQIIISGDVLRDENGDPIEVLMVVNSPDINGDLNVNLADVGMFCSNFFGQYSFRSDFHWDGVLNLADVGRLASGVGSQCP